MKDEAQASSRAWMVVAGLAATLGVALRARAFFADRSLWMDEAMLALNIRGRDFATLCRPLEYDQGAPVGFLWLERLSLLTFGTNELALRLLPFLASLATLALAYRFCRANLGGWGAAVGLSVLAVIPGLISYSGEAKQYSFDVAAGVLVLTLAADVLRLGLSPRRAAVLVVAGVVAVWLSHPVVFVLAGAGTTIIVKELVNRRPSSAFLAMGAAACWLVSFGAHYALSLKDLQSNSFLNAFWESGFLTFPPTSMNAIRQYVVVALGIFEAPFQNTQLEESLSERMSLIAAAAWSVGVVALMRRRERGMLMLLISPLAFAVVAAMLHKYPVRYRLALFTAGPTLLMSVTGVVILLRSMDGTTRMMGRILLVCLLLLPSMQAAQFLLERSKPYGARSVLERVAHEWQPGDLLLVDGGSEPSFRWYKTYGRIPGLDRVVATPCKSGVGDPAKLVEDLPALKGRSRVWILVSAHLPDRNGREAQLLRVTLDQWGKQLESVTAKGYYAYLYNFRSPVISLTGRTFDGRD